MSKYVLIVPSKLYPTRHIIKTSLERSRFPVQHSTVHTAVNHNRWLVEEWTSLNEIFRRNINLLKPTGHVMLQQFNIQQMYVLPGGILTF